jgi:chorismate mutase
MKTRDELRAEIDAIDSQLLDLLNRRAALAVEIAGLKVRDGIPILDPDRESDVLDRARAGSRDPLEPDAAERIFRAVMLESRRLQARVVQ